MNSVSDEQLMKIGKWFSVRLNKDKIEVQDKELCKLYEMCLKGGTDFMKFLENCGNKVVSIDRIFKFQACCIVGLLIGGMGQRRQVITSMEIGVNKNKGVLVMCMCSMCLLMKMKINFI